jgi:oxygen-dependent protoporphyrinogen oxidase
VTVAVVGAGVTGLAAAYALAGRGVDVVVYEASPRAGGVIRSERRDGYLVEHGPNSLGTPPPAGQAILARLGLDRTALDPDPAARNRFVVRRGRVLQLPRGPAEALTTPILSVRAKLRLLKEPFAAASTDGEESVAAFVRRRLGGEALDYLVDPLVGGIFAGLPEQLAVRHALPGLYALEREHGSLLRGVMRSASRGGPRAGRPGRRIVSFAEGMETIPGALADALGPALRLAAPVSRLAPTGGAWELDVAAGDAVERVRHDAVVWAAPAHALDRLDFAGAERAALDRVAVVPYAPVSVLVLGFRRDDVAHPLDGFGVLVPSAERRSILGAIFSSTLFPDRAPPGHVALTVFLGGARDPRLAESDAHTLTARALDDCRDLLGVHGEPVFRRHVFWPRAIPQYIVGYGRLHAAMDQVERANPRLFLAGTYRHGISVGEALASGALTADRVLRALGAGD